MSSADLAFDVAAFEETGKRKSEDREGERSEDSTRAADPILVRYAGQQTGVAVRSYAGH